MSDTKPALYVTRIPAVSRGAAVYAVKTHHGATRVHQIAQEPYGTYSVLYERTPEPTKES